MDALQTLTPDSVAITDDDGILSGFMLKEYVSPQIAARVVETLPPSATLPPRQRYRWVNGAWTTVQDMRGTAWYDPDDTDTEFLPKRFDDTPPAGWVMFNAATGKKPKPAEILRKKWKAVRQKRNKLMDDTDWVVTRATESGQPVSKEWREYRQALRDITKATDPDNIVWPTPPSA